MTIPLPLDVVILSLVFFVGDMPSVVGLLRRCGSDAFILVQAHS